ncbi:MAG: sulfatase-like hydrolase/transferase, partial [Rhodospirillales bacterium]|nr:sulfatase-like hydrolase/transferase [Rhodospirillales bacterium]
SWPVALRDAVFALPEQAEDAEEDKHITTRWLATHHGIDQFPPSDDTIRASRRAYYAMITQIDEYVGEIMAELKHLGLAEDTIVIFCSDHGDMMGERNMWFKRTFYDKSVKVPLIVHNPRRYVPKVEDGIVSLADLCPTVADIGGGGDVAEQYGNDHSHSFKKLIEGDRPEWKNRALMEYFGPGVEEPWVAIRQGDYKYVYTRNHEPLLFNVIEDPLETENLIDQGGYAELVEELHGILFTGLDLEATTARAVASKQTRVFLHQVLAGSEGYHWDYQPIFDATKQYVRGPNKPATC